jgi:NADH-quinone oxidoreductase subunit C
MMTREELLAFATEQVPELKAGPNKQFPEMIVPAKDIRELASRLKNDPATRMDYLFCLTASDRKDGFNVVYHITSSTYEHCAVMRVVLSDKANPILPSVSCVWKSAEFYEREVFDLFGILFQDHADMRRLFLDDQWSGYPLRKDYKDSFISEH